MAQNQNRALSMLSIAAKAGKVQSGGFLTEKAIQEGVAYFVIIAEDASGNTQKKFMDKCKYYEIPYTIAFDSTTLGRQIEKIRNQQVDVAAIEKIEAKSVPFSSKVAVEREDFERLSTLAKKYITAEKKESKLQKALDAANRLIARLKEEIAGLKQELSEYKSVRSKLRTSDLERENAELRGKVQHYEDVIQRNNLWHFFRPHREKVATREDVR